MSDNVNHPSHYETGKFECIDVMVETQGVQATKDFCLCNALKYIYRHRRKNGLEDIQKAIWYLNKAVELDGQIKELIDCRTIGESEPRYMEGRSNAPDCCRGLWLVYKVIIILFYSSQSCRRWCFTCKAVNLCHRDIKRCITSRFVGCTVVIFKRI